MSDSQVRYTSWHDNNNKNSGMGCTRLYTWTTIVIVIIFVVIFMTFDARAIFLQVCAPSSIWTNVAQRPPVQTTPTPPLVTKCPWSRQLTDYYIVLFVLIVRTVLCFFKMFVYTVPQLPSPLSL